MLARSIRRTPLLLLAPAALFLSLSVAARAEVEPETGRVSALEGDLLGWGPFDDEGSRLVRNSVLVTGDELESGSSTFAELEMPGETFVRLGPATRAAIDILDEERLHLSLAEGSLIVSRPRGAAPVVVATLAGDVAVGSRSIVLVRADDDESRLVLRVLKGEAELRGSDSWSLESGERLDWPDGRVERDDTPRDAFERWHEEREEIVRGRTLPDGLEVRMVGLHDLHWHGTWLWIDGGWAWCPSGVSHSWRPFGRGFWAWRHPYGWTWIDYEPWGHVTCHYGRWVHHHRHGWCWYPDRGYSRGWVAWASFGSHVGWAPCDAWGRPVRPHGSRSHYDPRSWSSCDRGYFRDGGGSDRCRDCAPPTHRPGSQGETDREPPRTHPSDRPVRVIRTEPPARYDIRPLTPERISGQVPLPIRNPIADLEPGRAGDAPPRRLQDIGGSRRPGSGMGGGWTPAPAPGSTPAPAPATAPAPAPLADPERATGATPAPATEPKGSPADERPPDIDRTRLPRPAREATPRALPPAPAIPRVVPRPAVRPPESLRPAAPTAPPFRPAAPSAPEPPRAAPPVPSRATPPVPSRATPPAAPRATPSAPPRMAPPREAPKAAPSRPSAPSASAPAPAPAPRSRKGSSDESRGGGSRDR